MRSLEVCKKCIQFGNMKDYWCALDDTFGLTSGICYSHSCANSKGADGKCKWCEKNRLDQEERLALLRVKKAEFLYKAPSENCPYKMEHIVLEQELV